MSYILYRVLCAVYLYTFPWVVVSLPTAFTGEIPVPILPLPPAAAFGDQIPGGSLQKGFIALRRFCVNESRQHSVLARQMQEQVRTWYRTGVVLL